MFFFPPGIVVKNAQQASTYPSHFPKLPFQPLSLQLSQPVQPMQQRPALPAQQQASSLLDAFFELAGKIVWETYKLRWEQVSPDSRKAWDVGAKLATSPSVSPLGQKFGAVLCAASFIAGLDEIDKASDD